MKQMAKRGVCLGLILLAAALARPLSAQVTFTEVTAAAGISGGAGSWAGVWGDYDGDGDADLFTIGHLQPLLGGKNQLWRNDGGVFVDVTAAAGLLSNKIDTHGAAWADFDHDGDLDLFLTNESIQNQPQLYHELWRNNGDGSFTELAESAGVIGLNHITRGVAVADFDRDGLPDILAIVQALQRYNTNNLLFRNNGNLTFSEAGESSGMGYPEGKLKRTGAWADYDGDGYPDVILMPDCQLLRNQGNGSFLPANTIAGIVKNDACQGAGWADYDNDGDLDLYVSRGFDRPADGVLYRNDGYGVFADVTAGSGIVNSTISRSVTWGDYDNDGDLDLYVVNYNNAAVPNRLFRNNGDGGFSEVTGEAGVAAQVPGGGSDASFVDYDDDGDLDLFLTNGESNQTGPYVLLRNNGNGNHWLKLRLIGTASNTDAIGARVRIEAAGATRYAYHTGPSHWMGQSSLPVHFGLGTAGGAEEIRIDWPNGQKQRLANIAADQTVTLTEGRSWFSGYALYSSPGFYVGQNGKRWYVSWRAEGGSRFSGRITSNGTLSAITTRSFEADDGLSWSADVLSFDATDDGRSYDAIEFESSGDAVTFELYRDGLAQPQQVFVGENRIRPASLPLTLSR